MIKIKSLFYSRLLIERRVEIFHNLKYVKLLLNIENDKTRTLILYRVYN